MIPEIVITGAGTVSAIGVGKEESLASLRCGKSSIGPVRYLKTKLQDRPVGEIPMTNEHMAQKAGAPEDLPRTSLMSILALQEAIAQAGIGSMEGLMLVSGTTVGGMDLTELQYPRYSALHSCGGATDAAARHFGRLFREATTLSTACSSAANAIIFGANLIRSGKCDVVVCGGSESLSNYHYNGFNSLMILDSRQCSPFDSERAGLNLGEGAAYLVLERAESARQRGVKPLARLSGWGNACDAFHQTASSENGEGAFLAMAKALKMAGLEPGNIDYVNAHGTGTPSNDPSESAALRRIFGESLPPVSSTKCLTGHTTSASGSVEAVFCLLAMREGFVPYQSNWTSEDPSCIVPVHKPMRKELRNVVCNAFGFGGNDSSLIFSAL